MPVRSRRRWRFSKVEEECVVGSVNRDLERIYKIGSKRVIDHSLTITKERHSIVSIFV